MAATKTDIDEAVDYKDTLNLPKTNFAMKANLANREPETLKFWQDINLYEQLAVARKDAPKFIVQDGPPYANGDIHLGHALNKILKDIVVKFKSISGFNVPFIPGWDCHGLPIELQVEKKVGKAGVKIDHKSFRKKCREYATKQIDIQRASFKRLGVLGDWDNRYATMDYKFEADVIRTLAKLIDKGHLVSGDKPVHWCIDCGSSLAEAEVEYLDKESFSIDVQYPIVDTQQLLEIFNYSNSDNMPMAIVIWTTTPWTLPASEAVCLRADLDYALVKLKDRLIIVAKDLVASLMARREEVNFAIVGECKGEQLEMLSAAHPFLDKQVPIILGEHVTTESGTGCVHTAPAHGLDDYIVGKKYNLPVYNPVAGNGCYYEDVEYFANTRVFAANAQVVELLEQRGNLFYQTKIVHSYPHCWRHKTPLIFRATKQWFISMDNAKLRDQALSAISDMKFIPDWGKNRIQKMVEGRPDWCISRQRTWGTPMAIFVHKQDGSIHPRTVELMEEVAKLVEVNGIDAWSDLDPQDLLGQDAEQYEKAPDTLDVWFDSGAVYSCVAAAREEIASEVVDLYLEGSDQHRGWFQTSLLSSIGTMGKAAFKQVLTHGFTVDSAGHKMSKSVGNVVSPASIMKTLGADVLRLWVASADYRGDLRISEEIFKRTSDTYRRIRNTIRFLLSNLHEFDPKQHMIKVNDMLALDSWVVSRAGALQQEILEAYDNYQFHVVYQKIHNFCVEELGSFYLDIIKDRQYTCKQDSVARRSAQTAMYHIVNAVVRWVAPVLSFTAEEIWQHLPKVGAEPESVFLATWYQGLPDSYISKFSDDFWQQVLQVKNSVNKALEAARKEGGIGSGLEAEVVIYADKDKLELLSKLADELRFVLITSQASVKPLADKTANAIEDLETNIWIELNICQHPKCERCWHRRSDVNANPNYPNICSRCIDNISTKDGEIRIYA